MTEPGPPRLPPPTGTPGHGSPPTRAGANPLRRRCGAQAAGGRFDDHRYRSRVAGRASPRLRARYERQTAGRGLRIDRSEPGAIQVLDRAAAKGHVRYEPGGRPATAELSEAGAALFANLYAHARTTTDAAVDGIDPAVLGTALDVLLTVGQHATAMLSGSPTTHSGERPPAPDGQVVP